MSVSGSIAYSPKVLRSLSSPGYFMNTRRGTLYQLTPHNSENLKLDNLIISQSDFQHCEKMLNSMAAASMSFKRYLGFVTEEEQRSKMIYLSPVDYYKSKNTIEGTSKPDTVKLFSNRGGNMEVTDESYYNLSAQIDPDILVSLTEIPTGAGKKSHKRSVEKTISFLDKAIAKFRPQGKENSEAKKALIFASIEGGSFDEQRTHCVVESLKRDIDGVVLHGIEKETSIEERQRQIHLTIELMGESKQTLYTVYSSRGSPSDILLGISEGIDFFEVDFPNQLAQKNLALNFDFSHSVEHEHSAALLQEQAATQLSEKQPKVLDLSLYEEFKEHLKPLVEGCSCYSCQNHTQAYIAHLVKCKELTSSVLLTIHNVHQYNELFASLQKAAKQNTLPQFSSWFISTNLV